MNSVAQAITNQSNSRKKGTGKGIALFFCVLFFVFQFFNTFFPYWWSDSADSHRIFKISNLISSENTRFSPFFFEPMAINYCDMPMLMSVNGIGPNLAEKIISTRVRIGKFSKPEDLLLVKGIGNNRLLKFTPYFSFQ